MSYLHSLKQRENKEVNDGKPERHHLNHVIKVNLIGGLQCRHAKFKDHTTHNQSWKWHRNCLQKL